MSLVVGEYGLNPRWSRSKDCLGSDLGRTEASFVRSAILAAHNLSIALKSVLSLSVHQMLCKCTICLSCKPSFMRSLPVIELVI